MAIDEFQRLKVKIERLPCLICGSEDYEWGYIDGAYQPGLLTTKLDPRRQLLAARKCLRCNNVQIFTDKKTTQRMWQTVAIIGIVFLAVILASRFLFPIMLNLSLGI